MKLYWFSISIFLPFLTLAQSKYDFHWTIGYDTSLLDPGGDVLLLDFNISPVYVQTKKTIDGFLSNGSGATMSDHNGNLIFYTSGCSIINSDHEIMENGDSLNPGVVQQFYCPFGYSPNPGGAIAIPWPDSPNLYLLFISDLERIDFPGGPLGLATPRHLYFNVIDMTQNGGLGAVILKNQVAVEDTLARASIEACRHKNGRDWWVMIPKSRSNCYFLMLITPDGVQEPILTCTGNNWTGDSGQACFTPDGSKFLRIEKGVGFHIYDFNNITGDITYNNLIVPIQDISSASVGISVSPNSKYLYVSLIDKLFQYDLKTADIPMSRVLLAIPDNVPDPFVPSIFTVSGLAPDGKIYISSGSSHLSLHVINRPDCPGLFSLPQVRGLELTSLNYYSIPNMPHFRIDTSNYSCDSIIVKEFTPLDGDQKVIVYPNPTKNKINIFVNHLLPEHSKWVLYNHLGGIAKSIEFFSGQEDYTEMVENLSQGFYFYGVISDGRVIQQGKLIILR